jgi:hypothetical protein
MNMDSATARAWLHGEIVRETSGGCYSEFSDVNVREVAYHADRPLWVCIDINIVPRVAVMIQPLEPGEYPADWLQPRVEQIGICGEYFSAVDTSDHTFAEQLCDGHRGTGDAGYRDERLRGLPDNWQGLESHKGPIIFYGDAEGNRRSAHDQETGSSWDIMMRVFRRRLAGRFTRDVPDSNPPARARIHAVNAKLRNADGKPSLSVSPRSRHTIKDFEAVSWDVGGLAEYEPRHGAGIQRTHCAAAVGYCIHRRSPFGEAHSTKAEDYIPRIGGTSLKVPRITGV